MTSRHSGHAYWAIALIIGLVAALVVAGAARACCWCTSGGSSARSHNLLEIAGKVGANTANIPQLEATAPVLALIVEEAVVQDGYMNALTDGFGQDAREHRHLHRPERPARRGRHRGARVRADPGAPGPRRRSRSGLATLAAALETASRPSTCARSSRRSRRSTPSSTSSSARCRGSPARRRSWPRGGRDDALVDRRRRPAARDPPGRRLPAARRARGGPEHRPERATRSRPWPPPARRTSTPPRCC